ncbi:ankyrin repeat and protein kinase domain-containing protein 1 [Aspergillus udagawae]|uniref:Ankyrin repeat and protein kinase domain-containing protein 1 n=1 Tax=Aspergillus udagawae TaxID=91492 RepID=A0A8H3SFT8_9EURO|nr:ankyrin repeat and protein kinase domain-containing protein 1 [Aspergillus udagawae]
MELERQPRLPTEIFLLIANYLDPQDLLRLLYARPGITSLLTHAHLRSGDIEGNTLLHLVAEDNIDNMISRLSPTSAAKSMGQNNAGQTPLHIAVKKGHHGIVRELLSTGCNPSPTDKYSRTPLHFACLTKQDITMVQLLLAHGADASAKDREDRTPIHICCTYGQVALLKTLIDAGADIDAAENGAVDSGARGQTPFHNAVLCGHTECAKILLERGADPNLLYGPEEHVIGSAVFRGQTELVQLMLDKGADVNRPERLGTTPLMIAAIANREQIARMLLHAGANPNIRGPRDAVPLHGAAREGLPSIVKLLLDGGADPSITDRLGFSPLDYATKKETTSGEHSDNQKLG